MRLTEWNKEHTHGQLLKGDGITKLCQYEDMGLTPQQIESQQQIIQQLQAQVARMRDVISELEFISGVDFCGSPYEYCPICNATREIVEDSGHDSGCKLAAALSDTQSYHNPVDVEALVKVKYYLTDFVQKEDCCSESCACESEYEVLQCAVRKALAAIEGVEK